MKAKSSIAGYKPLIFSLALFWIILVVIGFASSGLNAGNLIYSYDDAYIHMAIAKNTAQFGIWGINSDTFSSSSSSPVWTLLLAGSYILSGPAQITPLILNILFGSLIIFVIFIIFSRENIKSKTFYIFLTASILLIPIPGLVFTGLEHLLHILLTISLVYLSAEVISADKPEKKYLIWLCIISFIIPAVRYEGLLIVIFTVLLLVLNRKFLAGVLIFVLSLIPISIFGIFSISKGWSFFPNSLLLKGSLPDIRSFHDIFAFANSLLLKYSSPVVLIAALFFLIIFITGLFLFVKKSRQMNKSIRKTLVIVLLVLVNIIVFVIYSGTGWSYRYQAFLVALILFTVPIIFNGFTKTNLYNKFKSNSFYKFSLSAVLLIFLLIFVFFAFKSFEGMYKTPKMTNNIYEQQYQMAMFVKKYYNNSSVGLNDIGAVSYFSEAKTIDLWGLAYLPISQKIRKHEYTSDDIKNAASINNIKIAIVYDSWFSTDDGSLIPPEWIKAGSWQIKDNIIAGDDIVSFYAINTTEADLLSLNLKKFSAELPASVTQSVLYNSK
jgi:hypothetical protein